MKPGKCRTPDACAHCGAPLFHVQRFCATCGRENAMAIHRQIIRVQYEPVLKPVPVTIRMHAAENELLLAA